MAFYFLETSALVKLYVREPGTERMLVLATRSSENRLAILDLSQVELRSAIRRREKAEDIPTVVADELLATFKGHIEGRFIIQKLTDFVLDIASALVDRHTLRAFDAIQLAGYAVLKSSARSETPTFVCSDQALLMAAKQEGMAILDPSSTL